VTVGAIRAATFVVCAANIANAQSPPPDPTLGERSDGRVVTGDNHARSPTFIFCSDSGPTGNDDGLVQ